ncbi:hypothetical protein F5144DRAFT_493236 [Chaetomium tenue]|uniref:Uncharacterized protein n=1 Tax=Chaetomium tenue TaxID=1854479 RepID=A0ACB7P7R0_9PEZI|nr:hypothetical protein F5144DRAFT_493236 [Chaetomium globosum]
MADDAAGQSPSVGCQFPVFPSCTASPYNQQPLDCFDVTPEAIDHILLSNYRTELMPQHPFVVIPNHISAPALKSHRPVLMMSIRAIASFEGLQTMCARMDAVMRHITDKLFFQAERSLDLLMGIVVILGWHHHHGAIHSNLNNLLCLAESLVSDLGLNKKLTDDDRPGDETVIEGQRLLLGVWYLRSSASIYLRQLAPMPFTSYLRQCLANLQNAKTHELDQALVYHVNIQRLAERVTVLKSSQLGRADRGNGGTALKGFGQNKEIQDPEAAMAACQAYLAKLRTELPIGVKDDATDMVAIQLNTVDVRISASRESNALQCCAATSPPQPLYSLGSDSPIVDTLLHTAPTALKNWFQAWISAIPVARYRTLPSQAVFQLSYAVQTLIQSQKGAQRHSAGCSMHREPLRLASWSAPPSPGPLSGTRHGGSRPLGDEIIVVNRLIATGANPSDLGRFWGALGETSEAGSTLRHEIPQPSPLSDGRWDLRVTSFDGVAIEGGQARQPVPVNTFNTLPDQGFQGIYASDMSISPSKGYPVPLQEPGHSSGAPPLPMTIAPVTSHIALEDPLQWTAMETWNLHAQLWEAFSAGASLGDLGHENIVQQRWNETHRDPCYGWGGGV